MNIDHLTDRDRALLALVDAGLSPSEISRLKRRDVVLGCGELRDRAVVKLPSRTAMLGGRGNFLVTCTSAESRAIERYVERLPAAFSLDLDAPLFPRRGGFGHLSDRGIRFVLSVLRELEQQGLAKEAS